MKLRCINCHSLIADPKEEIVQVGLFLVCKGCGYDKFTIAEIKAKEG